MIVHHVLNTNEEFYTWITRLYFEEKLLIANYVLQWKYPGKIHKVL